MPELYKLDKEPSIYIEDSKRIVSPSQILLNYKESKVKRLLLDNYTVFNHLGTEVVHGDSYFYKGDT